MTTKPTAPDLREKIAAIVGRLGTFAWNAQGEGLESDDVTKSETEAVDAILAMLPVPIPQGEDGCPEEWTDLLSHQGSWRSGLVVALNTAEPATPDADDASFWQHEIDVFDRVWRALPRLIAIARAVGGEQ